MSFLPLLVFNRSPFYKMTLFGHVCNAGSRRLPDALPMHC